MKPGKEKRTRKGTDANGRETRILTVLVRGKHAWTI